MSATHLAIQTGKRKTAVARVYLMAGNGQITVNGKKLQDYFHGSKIMETIIKKPLAVTDNIDKFDILINVTGGGYAGQADACKHGIAKALKAYDPSNRDALRANGLLTRDPRMVERKKYGQRGARRKFQFSKR